MIKIKDFFGIEVTINKKLEPFFSKQATLESDLYALTKEAASVKYQIVELELRLSNLEEMVKTLTPKKSVFP